ncbi:carbon-nitrogen hydrolase family protein [Pseudomonas aeruginosa]|uniref:carbon-nitrogen hydrolase family protein n=1 Tax=Pseudomonas aeruginosa TaxID=287 RepID=UPI0037CB00B7
MTLIAAAQSCAHPADLPRNLDDHLRLMRIAQARGVRLLVFPELSLTGYEPSAAAALAQPADTPLLQPLRQLAEQARMTTVVGLPLRSPKHAKPLIAALILGADGSLGVYAKQHLHAGEERHFSAGDGGPLLEIDGLPMALAVCADFSQPSHPADSALLAGYAREHGMGVLLANHGGPTGGWKAAGRSAFWNERGALVRETTGTGETLLLLERTEIDA